MGRRRRAEVLAALGVRRDPLTGLVRAPDESTVRRVLVGIDGDALDAAVGAWLAGLSPMPALPAAEPPTPRRAWPAVAVDGKTLRGSGNHTDPPVHLLAAMRHDTTAVLGQVAVDGKNNEITAFRPLLRPLELTRTVVTADALHGQREHAQLLVTAYVIIIKRNQCAWRTGSASRSTGRRQSGWMRAGWLVTARRPRRRSLRRGEAELCGGQTRPFTQIDEGAAPAPA